MEEQLKLATIFTGRMDASFKNAVGQIRSILQSVGQWSTTTNTAATQTNKLAVAHQGLTKHMQHSYNAMERLKYALNITASYGLVSAAIYGTINALKTAVTEMGKFDQALKNIQAISSATDIAMISVKNTLLALAKDSRYSLTELSDAMVVLAQAGLTAEESVATIEAVSTLATGTLSNMETTADLLTTTLMAFNINATESGRVADVMATAVNKSKLDVDKLRVAFNYVASSAHETGVSLNETAAAMMVLANHGQRASTIGTGLRQVFAKLLNPSKALKESIASMGISLEDLDPKTAGFGSAMSYVTKILWDQKTATVDMQKAYKLFELRGAQAAAILVKAYRSGEYQSMLEDTWEFGSAQEMAAKQSEGLAIKFQKLINQAKVLAVSIGDAGVVGAMKSLLTVLKSVLSAITSFTDASVGQIIISFTLWTAAIWGTIRALKALSTALAGTALASRLGGLIYAYGGGVAGTMSAAGALTAAIAPYLAIAAAIAGLIVVYQRLITAQDRRIKKAQEELAVSNETVSNLEAYDGALEDLLKRFEKENLTQDERKTLILEGDNLIKEIIKTYPKLGDEIDSITGKYSNYKDQLIAINKLEKEYLETEQEDKFRKQTIALEELAKKIKTYNTEVRNAAINAKAGIPGAYGNILFTVSEKDKDNAISQMKDLIRDIIPELATAIFQGTKTWGEVFTILEAVAGTDLGLFDKTVKTLQTRITRLQQEAAEAARKSGIEPTGIFADMSDEMLKLYESLSTAQKIDFIPKLDTLKDEKIKLEESLKTAGLSDIEIEAFIKIKDEEFINEWKEKIYKTQNEIKQLSIDETAARGNTLKALQEELVLLKEKKAQVLATVNADPAEQKKALKDANLAITKQELAIQAEKDKQLQDQRSLEVSILALKKGSIAAQAQEIDNLKVYIAEQESREQSEVRINDLKQKRVELSKQEKALQNALTAQIRSAQEIGETALSIESGDIAAQRSKIANLESNLEMLKNETNFGNPDEGLKYFEAENALKQEKNNLTKAELDLIKKNYDLETNRITIEQGNRAGAEAKYRRAQDYLVLLQNSILPEEEKSLLIAQQRLEIDQQIKDLHIDTPVKELKKGIKETQVTWGEFWYDLGKQLPENFATGLTNAISAFTDGTKTAKEAFKSFAMETIKWISEIIIKQSILNAISNYFGNNASSSKIDSQSMMGKESVIGHTGGIFGEDSLPIRNIKVKPNAFIPKFHGGYNNNEMLAIVQKKEAIFTEAQQKALGRALGKRESNNSNYYDLRNSTFMDQGQLMQTMKTIASMEVQRTATNTVLRDVSVKDHPLRQYIRNGGN